MQTLRLASAVIELHPDGLTVTRYREGHVDARPHDTEEYRARARSLGYGSDTLAMSRDHEVMHHWLAASLGLPHSPTLYGVARGDTWPHWRVEEAAILGVQRYAMQAGVGIVDLASK